MKNLKYAILIVVFYLFATCEKNYIVDDNSDISTSTEDDSGNAIVTVNEDDDDYTWNAEQAVQIMLNGSYITADTSGVTINGTKALIRAAGTYIISGTLDDGQIEVNTEDKDDVKIILNNINIASSSTAPLYITDAKKVVLILADNSENKIADGSTYQNQEDGEPNAAVFSKADLSICGTGSLNIDANFLDGIAGKDGVIIKSGTIDIQAVDDGIRGKDYLVIHDGNISVVSGGDGLKSDNESNSTAGFITIDKGFFEITSGGDAISAVTDIKLMDGNYSITSGGGSNSSVYLSISAKGIKGLSGVQIDGGDFNISSADDAIHSNRDCAINGGKMILSSADDGIHADISITINQSEVSINKSYEGIESGVITLDESTVRIVASDDGFNATKGMATESNDNSSLTINSGYVYISSSTGDALDANGNIYINGGTVIAHGPSREPEVGMDYNGTCEVNGGKLIISGTNSNMTQSPGTGSSQYSVLIRFSSSLQANTIVHIEDSNGNSVLTFAPERTYQSIILSSSDLVSGGTYAIYTGGSCTGTIKDGLYEGGIYSGGTLYDSFTISGIVTTVGSSPIGPGPRW